MKKLATITKISVQVKNKSRFNIFLDGEYSFSVDESVLTEYQLVKGKEMDEVLLTEIQYEDDVKKAFNKAVNFLSYRMRTEKEVRDYLLKEEFDEGYIHEVIHKLNDYRYINDEEFAQAFVNTQMNTSDKGPNWIRIELKQKGVAEQYIESALTAFIKDVQIEKCTTIVEKLLNKYRKDSLIQAKQKIEQAILRKGFSSQVLQIVWEELETDREEDEQWDAVYHQGMKAHKRLSSKYSGFEYKQKMKQTLYRKGFSIESIERFLESVEE